MLTTAPSNGAALGGLKVSTARGWFAARPSGTENVYKIYAESFAGPEHLRRIQTEARELVSTFSLKQRRETLGAGYNGKGTRAGSNSMVESQPSKLLVAGSIPVSRSIFQ